MGLLDSAGKALGLGGDKVSKSEPWEPQIKHLKNIFEGAEGLYDQGPMEYYRGNTVAGTNQNMRNYFAGMGDYAQGGVNTGQQIGAYGQQMAGGLGQSQNYYSDAMMNYHNPYASVEYANQISDSVNNNPLLDQQIDQGYQDINRNLSENILPSIATGAVGTGNVGSMRRGVAEGVAARGAMEQGSDMAMGMRSNAYNQGINQANNWAQGEQFGQQYGMNAANQMAGLGQFGVGAMGQGYGLGAEAYQHMLGAGAYKRGIEQENINADRERWDFEQNAPWDNLARYNQMIQGNYGGTQTQQGDPSGALMNLGSQLGAAWMTGGASMAAPAAKSIAFQPTSTFDSYFK